MVSYLRSSDCAIRNKFPYVLAHWIGQMNNVLSVSAEDIDLNIQELQVVSVNDLCSLSMIDHVIDDGRDIIDSVDAEIFNQVRLGFLLLSGSKDSEPAT